MSAAPESKASISTEIVAICTHLPLGEVFYHNGEEVSRLESPIGGLSQPQPYKGPRAFILRPNKADFSVPEGQKPPAPLASVTLPENADRVLLICSKIEGKPLKLVAYDFSNHRVKAGQYQFFNFSKQPIALRFGGKKTVIKPSKHIILKDGAWQKKIGDLHIEVFTQQDAEWRRVYSSVWGHQPLPRHLVFLMDGSTPHRPIIFGRFIDFPKVSKN